MSVTDEEIRELIEVGPDGVLVWRELKLPDAPIWWRREIEKRNRRAGKPVSLWRHASGGMVTRLRGVDLYERRIRRALADDGSEGRRPGNGGKTHG